MNYYFNELDPVSFQRLINTILLARFGESLRLTPLRGADGGRDGETAPGNPYFSFQISNVKPNRNPLLVPEKGRYLFQVKHHQTIDGRISDARSAVLSDFETELKTNVLNRKGEERVNFFFLVTNVPSSKEALDKLDKKRKDLLRRRNYLHADIWWSEQITAFLDQLPMIWSAFPELFAGRRLPFLAQVATERVEGVPRAIRIAMDRQFRRDSNVKFRQIELAKEISKLFTDLDVHYSGTAAENRPIPIQQFLDFEDQLFEPLSSTAASTINHPSNYDGQRLASAIGALLDDCSKVTKKIVLEGGPGQGKSTITQMVVQIYRQLILGNQYIDPEGRWVAPQKARLPFRIELRSFGEWLVKNPDSSVEGFLVHILRQDAGGEEIQIANVRSMFENMPVLLIFDGLDEVGNDELRGKVIETIMECVHVLEEHLNSDLRVIITTRPPAITGSREQLVDFSRFIITPLSSIRIQKYVERWLSVQSLESEERKRIKDSFFRLQQETHVKALSTNPMQLSVLLHFIRLKGEAVPSHRSELYRQYFQIVIDRDVEKSSELREKRELIEALHSFLGYKIHALTESKQADGTLRRLDLLSLVRKWLVDQGNDADSPEMLFKLGEERLGLLVILRGEGDESMYGYEIQPIREYFAAAFINDQIRGEAHDVFEALVRRPFWKEVAIFLAGLRRPNEKADLVIRARALDNQSNLGWRQEGRHLIFQLLQEGVFSQPKHVFIEALDLVFDLLDEQSVRVQIEPRGYLEILPRFVPQDKRARYSEKVHQLMTRCNTSSDEQVVYRIHKVASHLLERKQYIEGILCYNSNRDDLIAKVRLYWPFLWGLDVSEASVDARYWQGVSDKVWARNWWQCTLRNGAATKLPAPPYYHQLMIEQFATNPTSFWLRRPTFNEPIQPLTPWVIWYLVRWTQLCFLIITMPPNGDMRSKLRTEFEHRPRLTFDGIDELYREAVSDFVEAYWSVLSSFVRGGKDTLEILSEHNLKLAHHLRQPGLVSWFAFRCSDFLMRFVWSVSSDNERSAVRRRRVHLADAVEQDGKLFDMWQSMLLLLPDYERFFESHELHTFQFYGMNSTITPSRLITEDNEIIDYSRSLEESIRGMTRRGSEWISDMPITAHLVGDVIRNTEDCLEVLLHGLGERSFYPVGYGNSLPISLIRRIISVVRKSVDPQVLRGALLALSNSKFLKLMGLELLNKIAYDHGTQETLAEIVFRRYPIPSQKMDKDEVQVLRDLAVLILYNPSQYAFKLVNYAASFLVESVTAPMQPLINEEEELKLFV